MAHQIVYGICENKCKVEVIPKEQLFDLIYPVGAIYMSVNNLNPSALFGGTWVTWGAGRVPVGIGTGTDSNGNKMSFGTSEGTGGEYTHKLIESELPRNMGITLQNTAHYYVGPTSDEDGGHFVLGTQFTGSSSSLGVTDVGIDGYHNNVQPYITCYMWKRTA